MSILVTGAGSGLGKAIHQAIPDSTPFLRGMDIGALKSRKSAFDAIIHCAFNAARGIDAQALLQVFYDNALLTAELMDIPHRQFVYMSTVDLYPWAETPAEEDMALQADEMSGHYRIAKLYSEGVVRQAGPEHLILRPTMLLGPGMRKSSLVRLLAGEGLALSPDSEYNLVLHEDIVAFVKQAIGDGICGTFNVASSSSITLAEMARIAGSASTFGKITYRTPRVSNRRLTNLAPYFDKSSQAVFDRFRQLIA